MTDPFSTDESSTSDPRPQPIAVLDSKPPSISVTPEGIIVDGYNCTTDLVRAIAHLLSLGMSIELQDIHNRQVGLFLFPIDPQSHKPIVPRAAQHQGAFPTLVDPRGKPLA